MNRTLRLLTSPGLWIPLLVAVPVLWALLPGGMPNTADGLVHFTRSTEMVHAWQDGVFIPRWAENLGLGYGIPLFVYAPPLPYFLTAGAYTLLGLPLDMAYKVMMVSAILIAVFGAYRVGAALLGPWAGAVSAAAFLYAPIMLRELFIQGNIAQYLAWAFAPWAAWAVIRIYSTDDFRPRAGYAIALALAVTGTLLSHNAAALVAVGMTASLAVILLLATRNLRALLATIGGGILGLVLSAWFWIPALFEGKYVALDRIVASDFRPRFISLPELIALSPRLDTGAINPYFPLTWGAVQVWLGVTGAALFLILLAVDRLRPSSAPGAHASALHSRVLLGAGIFFILFSAFCGFMATAWSEPVWTVLPFVDLFEWPFRWHGFTAVGLAWLCAFAVYATGRMYARVEAKAAAVALILLIGSAIVNLYPHKLAPGRLHSPAEVVRFEAKTNAIGTTSLGEFNPIWIEGVFGTSPLVADYLAGNPIDRLKHQLPTGASGQQTHSSVHRQEFRIELPQPATLTLNLLYFPGWRAQIDGNPIPVKPHPGSGLMDVELPAGEHTLVLTFGGTPLRRAANTISILAWIGLAVAVVLLVRPSGLKAAAEPNQQDIPAQYAVPVVAAVVIAAALLAATQAHRFRLNSPPDTAYPAQEQLRVDFGDVIRLLGVDPPRQTVKQEADLTLVAYLRALRSLDEDYTVFLHLDDPITGETLATVDQAHPGGIPTSDWATGLYVRSPLKLTVPEDADPIQYAVRLGFYNSQTGDLLPLDDSSSDFYEAGHVWVEAKSRPRPPDGPRVRFGDGRSGSIELLGATADPETAELRLYWQTNAPIPQDYSVFVHLLDTSGDTVGQLDGAPFANRYPTSTWRPNQSIEDRRVLAEAVPDVAAIDRIAVGLYDPTTGSRLPAYDGKGDPLSNNALIIPLNP